MYEENIEYVPDPKIKRSDYEELPLNEQIRWVYGGVVPDEDYVEPSSKKLWNNTIKGLTEDMKASHLGMLEKMYGDEKNPVIGKKMPKINESNIREAVEELVEEGLLLPYSAAHNKHAYYPNESLEGFRAYVKRMVDTRNKEPFRYLTSTRTTYYRRMLDRQLILDALKENNVSFSFDIMDKEGKKHMVAFPVVGRYPKIFEMDENIEWYSSTLQECLDCLKESGKISAKE